MSITHRNSPPAECASDVDRIVTKSIDSQGASRTATMPGDTSEGLATSGRGPDLGCVRYQANSVDQEVFSKIHQARELITDRYNLRASTRLTTGLMIECEDCAGSGSITHDHPNNPYARDVTCSMCDGTGEVVASCDCCREDAAERIDGLYMCAAHAAEARAEVVDAHLARIEVLLDWCREHVRPPPADLLYDAVGALQSLRAA